MGEGGLEMRKLSSCYLGVILPSRQRTVQTSGIGFAFCEVRRIYTMYDILRST